MSRLIKLLSRATGLHEGDVWKIVVTAPRRYKVYHIPKRSGGMREIAQPAAELKILQRALITEVLSALPVHPAATAYEPRSSIRANAEPHAKNGPILKMDFREFFPSIRDRDWRAYCKRAGILDDHEDLYVSTALLFRQPKGSSILRLSIGAPSSPRLSNIIMYEFDRRICERVSKDKVTYTRYADDMTFSAPRTGYLNHVEKNVRAVLKELSSPNLSINGDKTIYATMKYHRQVTGLVLTNQGGVSLGRKRKREIRAKIHHFVTGRLDVEEARALSGLLAFAKSVEPEFYDRMLTKYGSKTIGALRRVVRA